jgi:hypothetical protein
MGTVVPFFFSLFLEIPDKSQLWIDLGKSYVKTRVLAQGSAFWGSERY